MGDAYNKRDSVCFSDSTRDPLIYMILVYPHCTCKTCFTASQRDGAITSRRALFLLQTFLCRSYSCRGIIRLIRVRCRLEFRDETTAVPPGRPHFIDRHLDSNPSFDPLI